MADSHVRALLIEDDPDDHALIRECRTDVGGASVDFESVTTYDLLQATLDALSAHIAVLNATGTVIAVNAAWRHFAAENGFAGGACGLGQNYLAICDAAACGGEAAAAAVAVALRALLAGRGKPFALEYPCHSPTERRWFAVRVTPVGENSAQAVVAHEDITPRRLAEERTRFQAQLLDQVPAAVIATDAAGTVTHWNTHATSLYGWTPAEALGQPIHALTVGPADPSVTAAIWAQLRAGVSWAGEFVARRKDGTTFLAHVTDAPTFDEAGQLASIVGVSVDLSDREATEAALRASEAHYRALIQQAHDAVAILDATGTITYQSPTAARILGSLPADLLGTSALARVHPDDLPAAQAAFATMIAVPGASATAELRTAFPDGTWHWLEATATNLLGEPAVAGIVVNYRDITARKAAEIELRQAGESFASLFDAASDGMMLHDNGTILLANRTYAALIGYELDEIIGRNGLTFLTPESRAASEAHLLRRDERPYEVELLRRDGTTLPVEATGQPLRYHGRPARLVTVRDLTARHAAAAALQASEASLAAAQQLAHLGNWETDLTTGATLWSAESYRLFGLAPDAGAPSYAAFLAAIHPDDRARVDREAGDAAAALQPRSHEYRIVRPDGDIRVVLDRSYIILDDAGRPLRRLGAILDITERKALEGRLAHQAAHDALTGLPNRTLFLDRVERALWHGRRDGVPCAVLFLDLDRFKDVNDTLGHDTGDRILVAVAGRLNAVLRPGDTLARLGGDEFVVLLERVADADEAAGIAERLADAVRAPILLDDRAHHLATSVGVVLSAPEHRRPDDLLRDADIAMYRAKDAGGAGYALFDPAMQAARVARVALEADLRTALACGEFVLHYQPVVDLATGRIATVEALARWQHPTRGLIAPGDFIPLAEETGLIVPLGRWVLGEACRQARAWQAANIPLAVAINLTAREFQRPSLAAEVAAALTAAKLAPAWLRLEITESLAMRDPDATVATLTALRGLGVQVSIDDFGTGYSSLAYLKRLPADALKIDKAFVDGLETDAGDAAIMAAIVALAHTLGLLVVAEGVETAAQAAQLRALGCDLAQGYHFARPLPADDLAALLGVGTPLWTTPAAHHTVSTGELVQRRAARARRLLLPAAP